MKLGNVISLQMCSLLLLHITTPALITCLVSQMKRNRTLVLSANLSRHTPQRESQLLQDLTHKTQKLPATKRILLVTGSFKCVHFLICVSIFVLYPKKSNLSGKEALLQSNTYQRQLNDTHVTSLFHHNTI